MSDSVQRILHLMNLKQITAKALTEMIGLYPSAISEWKKGKAKPSAEALVSIATHFEIPIEYLLCMGVFENWEEITASEDSREAIIDAVYCDWNGELLATGRAVLSVFYNALDDELEMIRFFSWAVKSVRFSGNKYNDEKYAEENRSPLVAHIEYTNVLKSLISTEHNTGKVVTMKEMVDDFVRRMESGPYANLEEDEKRLLDKYRELSEIQKGKVFETVSNFKLRPFA